MININYKNKEYTVEKGKVVIDFIRENLDVEVGTSYNKDKCKISKVNETYVVTCLYSDLLNEEAKEIFNKLITKKGK